MSIVKITSIGLLMGLMSGCVSAYDRYPNSYYRGGNSYNGSIQYRYYTPPRGNYNRNYRNDYQRQTSPAYDRIRPSDAGVNPGYGSQGGNSYSGSINGGGGNSYN